MKKIIAILRPTFLKQTIFIYEDTEKLDTRYIKTNDLPKEVFELANRYNINNIEIYGPVTYIKGIKNQIQEFELSKYNKNILNIRCK